MRFRAYHYSDENFEDDEVPPPVGKFTFVLSVPNALPSANEYIAPKKGKKNKESDSSKFTF